LRVAILAVGRLRAGPEAELLADYLSRFDRSGRALGIGPARAVEVEDRRGGGPVAEAVLLAGALAKGAVLVALDERGSTLSSPEFASLLRRTADSGARELAFAIGGAGGLDAGFREGAAHVISFGAMVWPHMLARVMLAEQLYRATSILAGTPYHRGG